MIRINKINILGHQTVHRNGLDFPATIIHGTDVLWEIYNSIAPSVSFLDWLDILHVEGLATHLESHNRADFLIVDFLLPKEATE